MITHSKRRTSQIKSTSKSVHKHVEESVQESRNSMSHLGLQQGVECAEPFGRRDVVRADFCAHTY